MHFRELLEHFSQYQFPETGLLLIDKPAAVTSHDVVDVVRKLTHQKRVGHAGTLDPLATGLLLVLVGREWTTRQAEFLHLPKVYRFQAQLGVTTDTYDADGQVQHQADLPQILALSDTQLRQTFSALVGSLMQTVPSYSAVKIQGQKLYEMARSGQTLPTQLPQRQVEITRAELVEIHRTADGLWVEGVVGCSSGTYIRSLIHDWGQTLGVGATITALRRVSIGEHQLEQAIGFSAQFWPALSHSKSLIQ